MSRISRNIRVSEESYRRLKLKSLYWKKTLMEVVDELSKINTRAND